MVKIVFVEGKPIKFMLLEQLLRHCSAAEPHGGVYVGPGADDIALLHVALDARCHFADLHGSGKTSSEQREAPNRQSLQVWTSSHQVNKGPALKVVWVTAAPIPSGCSDPCRSQSFEHGVVISI